MLTFKDFEHSALRTLNPKLLADFPSLALFAAVMLAGEGGETLGWFQKHHWQGHDLNRDEVLKELGDALWAITVCAFALGVDLATVAQMNREKLQKRYPDGFTTELSKARLDGTPLKPPTETVMTYVYEPKPKDGQ